MKATLFSGDPCVPSGVRLYLSSARGFERGCRLLQACLDGFWLGMFDKDLLHAIDEVYYNGQIHYANKGYNQRGLWDWERAAVDRHFSGRRRICVSGAGGGREILALLQSGHDAFGFDCNEKLVRVANELLGSHGYPDRVLLAPRDGWPLEAGQCDGIILGWGSYMLIAGRRERIAFLRQARSRLPVGAPILLSFFARSGDSPYFRLVAAIGNLLRRARRRPLLELGDTLAPNYVHFFTEQQVAHELCQGGFEMVAYETIGYGHAVGVSAPTTPGPLS